MKEIILAIIALMLFGILLQVARIADKYAPVKTPIPCASGWTCWEETPTK